MKRCRRCDYCGRRMHFIRKCFCILTLFLGEKSTANHPRQGVSQRGHGERRTIYEAFQRAVGGGLGVFLLSQG